MAGMESSEGEERKKVVVVSGGVGGSLVARSLQFNTDVILIDLSIQLCTVLLTLLVAKAVDIKEGGVVTEDGNLFPYDYLLAATGHRDSVPRSRRERIAQYQEEFEKIKFSNSILIIGGGPTGVELAGEIAVDFPGKKVTLKFS
ncbi:hypothetical protein CRG98_007977 [Punica granatum]|uniref:FAD/NAD(P)-binding domain-containing protein n=1 Tax=Punica granatum TaxID=22663 RepID=A0A2I0KT51_PUNGR|nr:hypothetical protein CRG98_007977 [Punica granatum]